jgi:hypothetical protein
VKLIWVVWSVLPQADGEWRSRCDARQRAHLPKSASNTYQPAPHIQKHSPTPSTPPSQTSPRRKRITMQNPHAPSDSRNPPPSSESVGTSWRDVEPFIRPTTGLFSSTKKDCPSHLGSWLGVPQCEPPRSHPAPGGRDPACAVWSASPPSASQPKEGRFLETKPGQSQSLEDPSFPIRVRVLSLEGGTCARTAVVTLCKLEAAHDAGLPDQAGLLS